MNYQLIERALGRETAELIKLGNETLALMEQGKLTYNDWLSAILKGRKMAVSEELYRGFLHAQIDDAVRPEWLPRLSRDLAKEGIEIGSDY